LIATNYTTHATPLHHQQPLPGNKPTSRLPVLRLGPDARADARGTGAAAACAVRGAEALAADELPCLAVADVLDACGIECRAAFAGSARTGASWSTGSSKNSVSTGGLSRRGLSSGGTGSGEAAARLAVLSLGPNAGADAGGVGAAGAGAVGVAEALAADELRALAVADVLGSRGVERRNGGCEERDCGCC